MMVSLPGHIEPTGVGNEIRPAHYAVLGAICAFVIGVYVWSAKSGWLERLSPHADTTHYNLLVEGFHAGQLNVKQEVPSGLAQLADPYDPKAIGPYLWEPHPLHDLSYYQGKLYLYFGVTPALVLFWPYHELTGGHLLHRDAVLIFCGMGFLASVGLLWAVWRRYFAKVGIGVIGSCTLALGLAAGPPLLLSRSDVYEVAISCGYALLMLALVAIWKALHDSQRRGWWLGAASLAYGLAIGARPSLLFGAVILLVPVVLAWREAAESGRRRRAWLLLLAATVPIVLIGLGLMLYNFLRFDDPFEFGHHLALSWDRQATIQHFSLGYLWYNFRVYFLEPAQWDARFPFVHDIRGPALPTGHAMIEHPFGILTNIPLVWMALAALLFWRGRLGEARSALRDFAVALVAQFGISALTLGLFQATCARYEVEFLPALVLLAVLGILGLERALAGRLVWRRATRWGWGLLLVFSVAFNLFVSIGRQTETEIVLGNVLLREGRTEEAIAHFQEALALEPDNAGAHSNLGAALSRQGKVLEAIGHLEEALRLQPDYAEAHNSLGFVLFQKGKVAEAMGHYQVALRLKPDHPEAHNNLAVALFQEGKVPEAIGYWEQAVRLKPDFADAYDDLGTALFQLGRLPQAAESLEEALRLDPGDAEKHFNYGVALYQLGRVPEAIRQYEQALQLKPDIADAHSNLGKALLRQGKVPEAIGHLEQALRLQPGDAEAHNNLGTALFHQGKAAAAIEHLEEALRFKPESAQAHYNLATALIQQGRAAGAIAQYEQTLRLKPDNAEVQNDLAWVLATCPDGAMRDGAKAVELAKRANQLAGGKNPDILKTLAAAYAEAGQFWHAVKTEQAALRLVRKAGQAVQEQQIEERLHLYKARRPYREDRQPPSS